MVRGRDAVVGGGWTTWKSESKSLPLQPCPTEMSETVCKLLRNHDTSRSRAAPQMSQITAGLTRHCARSGWTLVLLCVSVVVTALVGCAVMARVCRTGREENGKGGEVRRCGLVLYASREDLRANFQRRYAWLRGYTTLRLYQPTPHSPLG